RPPAVARRDPAAQAVPAAAKTVLAVLRTKHVLRAIRARRRRAAARTVVAAARMVRVALKPIPQAAARNALTKANAPPRAVARAAAHPLAGSAAHTCPTLAW